jgi:hypothetical protein
MPRNVLNGLKSTRIGVLNSGRGSFGATNVQFIMVLILGKFRAFRMSEEKWDKDCGNAQTKNKGVSLIVCVDVFGAKTEVHLYRLLSNLSINISM